MQEQEAEDDDEREAQAEQVQDGAEGSAGEDEHEPGGRVQVLEDDRCCEGAGAGAQVLATITNGGGVAVPDGGRTPLGPDPRQRTP